MKVIVAGDVFIDRYVICNSNRSDQTSAAPVAHVEEILEFPGGAANVAFNISEMTANDAVEVTVAGAYTFYKFYDIMHGVGMISSGPCRISEEEDTIKERIIVNDNTVVRIDHNDKVAYKWEHSLVEDIKSRINDNVFLVISDYCKGTFKDDEIAELIGYAKDKGCESVVDAKICKDAYKGASVLKFNDKDFIHTIEGDRLEDKLKKLETTFSSKIIMTCGSRGYVIRNGNEFVINSHDDIPTFSNSIGAGDAFISGFVAARAKGLSFKESCKYADIAGRLSVRKKYTSTVCWDEINEYRKPFKSETFTQLR